MPRTHEFYELHEMLKLEIHIQEAGENGRDVITFVPSGQPTEIEARIGTSIRKSIIGLAIQRNAATKYEKNGVLDPRFREASPIEASSEPSPQASIGTEAQSFPESRTSNNPPP